MQMDEIGNIVRLWRGCKGDRGKARLEEEEERIQPARRVGRGMPV
jgi:hypothetical protein